MSLVLGTSGWSYNEWVGPFYDERSRMFTRYSEVFRTSEINSTFYRYPTPTMVRGWYRTAPPGFIFAAKLPQLITHDKGLRLEEGIQEDTERFIDIMKPLAEKLGPILIQLPPGFKYGEDAERLESYLETLPRNYEWAVEFRHRSWMRAETWEMLSNHGVAYTIVDEPLLPPEAHVTADLAYIRMHGRGLRPWYNYDYKLEELEEWVPKVKETMERAEKVYAYFNNHFKANAVKNAVEMLQLLNMATPEQVKVLKKIKEHGVEKPQEMVIKPLESFIKKVVEDDDEEEGLSVADLLMRFTSSSRLQRAEEIADDELVIKKRTGKDIEAKIRDYSIEIDVKGRVIRHDCDDWQKGLGMKRMCKHVDKLFLSLPKEQAREILTEVWEEKDKWRFE